MVFQLPPLTFDNGLQHSPPLFLKHSANLIGGIASQSAAVDLLGQSEFAKSHSLAAAALAMKLHLMTRQSNNSSWISQPMNSHKLPAWKQSAITTDRWPKINSIYRFVALFYDYFQQIRKQSSHSCLCFEKKKRQERGQVGKNQRKKTAIYTNSNFIMTLNFLFFLIRTFRRLPGGGGGLGEERIYLELTSTSCNLKIEKLRVIYTDLSL